VFSTTLRVPVARTLLFAMAVAVVLVAFSSLAASADPGSSSEDSSEGGTLSYEPLSEDDILGESDTAASEAALNSLLRAQCNYTTEGDNPHLSSTGFAASAHGWWNHSINSSCPLYADVTVTLQAKLCYTTGSSRTCWWETVDHQVTRILAGGGSGRRTTARNDCLFFKLIGYRSIIDVDLVGVWDGPFKLYRSADVLCYPA